MFEVPIQATRRSTDERQVSFVYKNTCREALGVCEKHSSSPVNEPCVVRSGL